MHQKLPDCRIKEYINERSIIKKKGMNKIYCKTCLVWYEDPAPLHNSHDYVDVGQIQQKWEERKNKIQGILKVAQMEAVRDEVNVMLCEIQSMLEKIRREQQIFWAEMAKQHYEVNKRQYDVMTKELAWTESVIADLNKMELLPEALAQMSEPPPLPDIETIPPEVPSVKKTLDAVQKELQNCVETVLGCSRRLREIELYVTKPKILPADTALYERTLVDLIKQSKEEESKLIESLNDKRDQWEKQFKKEKVKKLITGWVNNLNLQPHMKGNREKLVVKLISGGAYVHSLFANYDFFVRITDKEEGPLETYNFFSCHSYCYNEASGKIYHKLEGQLHEYDLIEKKAKVVADIPKEVGSYLYALSIYNQIYLLKTEFSHLGPSGCMFNLKTKAWTFLPPCSILEEYETVQKNVKDACTFNNSHIICCIGSVLYFSLDILDLENGWKLIPYTNGTVDRIDVKKMLQTSSNEVYAIGSNGESLRLNITHRKFEKKNIVHRKFQPFGCCYVWRRNLLRFRRMFKYGRKVIPLYKKDTDFRIRKK
eukprot:TRINITY_DN100_c2_g3_i1.p1 TRINITY_DN100_c2_g3~~TRINITY_DN100_c2_g3_i1.p1  ORF type:complete len:540 (-),score=42.03 TRINITY_DN100_c2_g3_i1:344-1963(-)